MKGVVIFSGFNMRALYAFIRTLEKHALSYFIVASDNDDQIFKTKYKEKVCAVRQYKELNLQDIINCINKVQKTAKLENYLIAPSTEALNRFLLEHRVRLWGAKCEVPLVQRGLYEKVSNKHSFGQLCREYEIEIPKELPLESFGVPCVAKPRQYYGGLSKKMLKPILIFSESEKESFLQTSDVDDFYIQKFIDGQSFYLLYYFFQDGSFINYSQENLIQQSEGGSILAAKSSNFHMRGHSEQYEKLFTAIQFHGLVMVEIKQDKKGTYMIEANPRFWGPSQLFVDAGVNFFEAMLSDYNILDECPECVVNIESAVNTSYFWSDGFSFQRETIEKTVFYNYSKKIFFNELAKWKQVSVLNRPDTLGIYKEGYYGGTSAK